MDDKPKILFAWQCRRCKDTFHTLEQSCDVNPDADPTMFRRRAREKAGTVIMENCDVCGYYSVHDFIGMVVTEEIKAKAKKAQKAKI